MSGAVSQVLLVLLLAVTVEKSSGMPGLIKRGLENEEVWEAILYGYIVDADSPDYLARGNTIFNVTNIDRYIARSANPTMESNFQYSDSEQTAAKNVAASLSVEASYGAFSAAASMQVSTSTDKSIKTVRMDSVIRAIKYEIASKNTFRTFPEEFLTENFKRAVKELPVEKIADTIGVFYAHRLDLGGEVKKSYTMQATKEDNESKVTAELQASYGGLLFGASVKASVGVTTRQSNSNSQMNVEWSAKGGDTTVWLGKDLSNQDTSVYKVQEEWAKTITDNNLFPFNFELGLMWDLVKAVDQKKGEEFQQYLETKWEGDLSSFNPTGYIRGNPVGAPLGDGYSVWSDWSNDNFGYHGFHAPTNFKRVCLPGNVMESIRLRDQVGYGTLDFLMICSTGSQYSIFHGAGGGHYQREIRCDSKSNYGFQGIRGREQDGYGIINAAMRCSGGKWETVNQNHRGYLNNELDCPEGWVVTGIEAKEQPGKGIINFKIRCTEILF